MTTDVVVKVLDAHNYELVKDVSVSVTHKEHRYSITIPATFVSDFASIPRLIRLFFPRHHNDYKLAALVHDYLCAGSWFTAAERDGIFFTLIKSRLTSWLFWFAVRIFNPLFYRPSDEMMLNTKDLAYKTGCWPIRQKI